MRRRILVSDRSPVFAPDRSPQHRPVSRKANRTLARAAGLHEHPNLERDTILQLQRQAGNEAVTGLLTQGMRAVGDLVNAGEQLLSSAVSRRARTSSPMSCFGSQGWT